MSVYVFMTFVCVTEGYLIHYMRKVTQKNKKGKWTIYIKD